MSSHNFHHLRDLNPASYNWNVKVRVIRSWRGFSKTGEAFKGLNILLLDEKVWQCCISTSLWYFMNKLYTETKVIFQSDRIHAFIPGNLIENHEEKLHEGNICTIANFSVKDYRTDEKFRCVNGERQIVFTSYTQVHKVDVDDKLIPKNMFDFYDLSDLMDIANENVFLTGNFLLIWLFFSLI